MRAIAPLLLLAPTTLAQNGDRDGEDQPPLPDDLVVPAAPTLSAAEELATFVVADGYRVELVAAEPLVNDPIAAEFDERGRLWVVEMTGYMPDVDGTDEDAPIGAIAVLSDDDGDGAMDSRVVFMDELVLPRSVHPTQGGALVILPEQVLFCRDEDGDGDADEDERLLIDTFRGGIHSPEHSLNGFEYTLDNAYRCANMGRRYRWNGEAWVREATTGGGQWGITKDDEGRVFYNTNSDPFRGDLFPSVYGLRNPNHGKIAGLNARVAPDRATWPIRITPGVNRGYRKGTLNDDFTLRSVTAVCGPHVYRGDAAPELRGSAIVPEPSGNLVKRYTLRDDGLKLVGDQAYQGREFLASTDERFRPVNAFGGPDGALYLVDMYRGILQHRLFVTTWLRNQIVARELETPLGLGRIWRVVPEDHGRPAAVDMGEWGWGRLVDALSSDNGWLRDAAQRVIVEEWDGDPWVVERLGAVARDGAAPLGRLHALWALDGLDWATREVLLDALGDEDERVVRAAMRVAETFLSTGRPEPIVKVLAAARAGGPRTVHQALCSLGAVRTEAGDAAMAQLLTVDCASGELRSAAMSGLYQRELAFLEALLAREEWAQAAKGRAELLKLLATAIVRNGQGEELASLVAIAAGDEHVWRAKALLEGLLAGREQGPKGDKMPVRVVSMPAAFDALSAREGLGDLPSNVAANVVWPGKPGAPAEVQVRPLTEEEHAWYVRGQEIYTAVCAGCHQPSGRGEGGKAPRLRGSPWVLDSEQRLTRILAQGLVGELKLDGVVWDMEMPALAGTDEDLAAVLTYIRREWGHGADPITPATVRAVREAERERGFPWTVDDLMKVRD